MIDIVRYRIFRVKMNLLTILPELLDLIILKTNHATFTILRRVNRHFNTLLAPRMPDDRWWYHHLRVRGLNYTGSHPMVLALIFDRFSSHHNPKSLYLTTSRHIVRLEDLLRLNIPDITIFMLEHGYSLYIEKKQAMMDYDNIREKRRIYHTLFRCIIRGGICVKELLSHALESTAGDLEAILPLPDDLKWLEAELPEPVVPPLSDIKYTDLLGGQHPKLSSKSFKTQRGLTATMLAFENGLDQKLTDDIRNVYRELGLYPPQPMTLCSTLAPLPTIVFVGIVVECKLPSSYIVEYYAMQSSPYHRTAIVKQLIRCQCYTFLEEHLDWIHPKWEACMTSHIISRTPRLDRIREYHPKLYDALMRDLSLLSPKLQSSVL